MGLAREFVSTIEDERIRYMVSMNQLISTPYTQLLLVFDLSIREIAQLLDDSKTMVHKRLQTEQLALSPAIRNMVTEKLNSHKRTGQFTATEGRVNRLAHMRAATDYLNNGL